MLNPHSLWCPNLEGRQILLSEERSQGKSMTLHFPIEQYVLRTEAVGHFVSCNTSYMNLRASKIYTETAKAPVYYGRSLNYTILKLREGGFLM